MKGKNWGPILLAVSHVIGSSRAKFIERCKEALNNLVALTAAHREHYGEPAMKKDVELEQVGMNFGSVNPSLFLPTDTGGHRPRKAGRPCPVSWDPCR
ncbi:hypothetical protein D3C84_1115520 [compost metagenome]